MLQVITSKHRDLRRISVDLPFALRYLHGNEDPVQTVGEWVIKQWLDLDRILVYLWESFSIRTNVGWIREGLDSVPEDYIECLLPELTKRGMIIVDQVE